MTKEDQVGKEYWTTKELAKAAGLTDGRIRQLLRAGEVQGVHIAGVWLVRDTEARRWLSQRTARDR
jgi:hypothetical protein